MGQAMPSSVKPEPIALVVCDNIYHEQSGKTALVGLFNGIRSRGSGPIVHPRMAVFASLTGVKNDSVAKVEIVHGETDHAVVVAEGPLPIENDPVGVVDMNFVFQHVVFPEPGQYFVRLWGNGHCLLMRPFEVTRIDDEGAEE